MTDLGVACPTGSRSVRPDRRSLRGGKPGSSATPAGSVSPTVLDLRGLRCPELVLRAKTALRRVSIGGTLVLECTDPLAVIDVPVFVHRSGHMLTREERRGDLYIFQIVKQR